MQPTWIECLSKSLSHDALSSDDWQALIAWEWSDLPRAHAFSITPDTVIERLQQRWQWLQTLITAKVQFPLQQPIETLLPLLWRVWIPLAIQMAESQEQRDRPLIQGILGIQGTGKTTLAKTLGLILAQQGYRVVSLSIDDLYKTYEDRQRLRQADPRLIWRGPPGTHDIDLGIAVLQQLREAPEFPIAIPRFDKSAWNGEGDRTQPEWVAGTDIVLFEGWFVGVHPIDPTVFDQAPAPIVTEGDRTFAVDMNQRLDDYIPLWNLLDRLILLYPQDYRLSQQWRREAEHQMTAAGKSGMSDQTLHQFVEYFWKALHPELFIKPMRDRAAWVDIVIEIHPNHQPGAIYKPGDHPGAQKGREQTAPSSHPPNLEPQD